jgi:hypothetical protein
MQNQIKITTETRQMESDSPWEHTGGVTVLREVAIWGTLSGGYEVLYILGYNAV